MNDNNRYFRELVLVGIMCLAALSFAAVVTSAAVAKARVLTVADAAGLPTSSEQPACEVLCDDDVQPYCDPDEHLVWNTDDGAQWLNARRRGGAHPTTCYEQTCTEQHDLGQCSVITEDEPPLTPESTEDLRQAILAGDSTEVQALLEAHPSQLVFNLKRSAIQIIACNGRLREHMPLPDEIATALVVAAH